MTTGYYVSAFEAQKELARRAGLRAQVETYWQDHGICFPSPLLSGEPIAVMGRHVGTFRLEDAVFVRMAESAGLRPLWLTYHSDKFVTVSPFKRSLINPYMTSRLDKRGGYIAQKKVLTLPDRWVGRPISTITFDDHGRQESIAAFHERRLRVACPDALVFDTSYACGGWGGRASEYYKAYLSLFLAHSVLFEDYHGGESGAVLGGFTNSVFEPAFKALKEQFGVRPLIVPLPWWPELAYYPDGEFLAGWRTEKAFAALATRLAA